MFISHAHEDHTLASEAKELLRLLGFTGFVAHVDIAPTRLWEDEILRNLRACVAMVVVSSAPAQRSSWVNQEIGFAVATNTPVVVIKNGLVPWGMLARFQAMGWKVPDPARHYDEKDARKTNHKSLYTALADLGVATKTRLISGLGRSGSFDEAGVAAKTLATLGALTSAEASQLAEVCLSNDQVSGSYSATGRLQPVLKAAAALLPEDLRARLVAKRWALS